MNAIGNTSVAEDRLSESLEEDISVKYLRDKP